MDLILDCPILFGFMGLNISICKGADEIRAEVVNQSAEALLFCEFFLPLVKVLRWLHVNAALNAYGSYPLLFFWIHC
jgi:hypothetical protein